jgi:hypothetical protein
MQRVNHPKFIVFALLMLVTLPLRAAEDRRERVLSDRRELQDDAHWIYNDLSKAFAVAAETRKPMLVVFRCVP